MVARIRARVKSVREQVFVNTAGQGHTVFLAVEGAYVNMGNEKIVAKLVQNFTEDINTVNMVS